MLRLLIIQAADGDAEAILDALRQGGIDIDAERVRNRPELIEALERRTWHAVIADIAARRFSALDAVTILKQRSIDVPLIIVADRVSLDVIVPAIKAGASDFVPRTGLARLVPTLERELAEAAERRRRRRVERARAHFVTVLETTTDFVSIFGVDGRLLHINPAGRQLLGIGPDEDVRQLALTACYPAWAHERLLHESVPAAIRDGVWSGDTALLSRDGREIAVSQVLTARKTPDGAVEFLSSLARDITDHKLAEERSRREAARAEALVRVASQLNARLDLTAVLKAVSREVAQALAVPIAGVSLYEVDALSSKATRDEPGPGGQPDPTRAVLRLLYSLHDEQPEALIAIPDTGALPDVPEAARCAALGIGAVAGAFLQRDERLVGVLYVAGTDQARPFSDDDMALLQGVADQAAQAIANARLFTEAERRLAYLQALRAIDMAISASLDLRLVFHVLLDQIIAQLRVDAAAILLLNEVAHVLEYVDGRGFRSTDVQRARLRLGEDFAGRVALDRRLLSVPDLRAAEECDGGPRLAGEGFHAYYAVPLIAKGQLKGVLEVFHRAPLEPNREWLSFLEALAGRPPSPSTTPPCSTDLQRSNAELSAGLRRHHRGLVARARPARQGDRGPHAARHRADPAAGARDGRERGRAGAHAARRAAARHRQDGRARPHPAQARPARRGGVGDHAPAPDLRLRAAVADRLPAAGAGHPLLPPREVGRHRLPARAERRTDPAGRAHLRRRGRVGRAALRPALSRGLAGAPGDGPHPGANRLALRSPDRAALHRTDAVRGRRGGLTSDQCLGSGLSAAGTRHGARAYPDP